MSDHDPHSRVNAWAPGPGPIATGELELLELELMSVVHHHVHWYQCTCIPDMWDETNETSEAG